MPIEARSSKGKQVGSPSKQLAMLGGSAIAGHLVAPDWPPRSELTRSRLLEIYDSGNWAFGMTDDLDSFSRHFAAAHDAQHGIFMANGTVTLMCALSAKGIGPGDEVIVPAYTWLATATAVKYVGAKVVFVDVEADTLCMDPQLVDRAITKRTRAIIPVHFMGSMVDMDALVSVVGNRDIVIVEDCAQAHGSKWNGRAVGSIGDIGSFSFQHNKIMSSGEGGICITNDADLAVRLYRSAYIGYAPGEKFGNFKSGPPIGLECNNLRGTQFQAVLLQEQLDKLPQRVSGYWQNAQRLVQRLENLSGVRVQTPGRLADPQSYYKVAFVFDAPPMNKVPIATIQRALVAEGVPVIPSYGTVPGHILFNLEEGKDFSMPEGGIPVTESIGADRVLMLAHQWLGASEQVIDTIASAIEKVVLNATNLMKTASDRL